MARQKGRNSPFAEELSLSWSPSHSFWATFWPQTTIWHVVIQRIDFLPKENHEISSTKVTTRRFGSLETHGCFGVCVAPTWSIPRDSAEVRHYCSLWKQLFTRPSSQINSSELVQPTVAASMGPFWEFICESLQERWNLWSEGDSKWESVEGIWHGRLPLFTLGAEWSQTRQHNEKEEPITGQLLIWLALRVSQ